MDTLRGKQGEFPSFQIEAHLIAEDGLGTYASTIFSLNPVLKHML